MPIRDFRDASGKLWYVYEVRPLSPVVRRVAARSGLEGIDPSQPVLDSFGDQRAWLCFESGKEKRRLLPVPADWQQLSPVELEKLCSRAATARPIRLS